MLDKLLERAVLLELVIDILADAKNIIVEETPSFDSSGNAGDISEITDTFKTEKVFLFNNILSFDTISYQSHEERLYFSFDLHRGQNIIVSLPIDDLKTISVTRPHSDVVKLDLEIGFDLIKTLSQLIN